jgi:glycosyltransferase involved in cell wall biosynthesis
MKIDAVIPAYNEADNIEGIISTLLAHKNINRVIVSVDIKTTDNTAELARRMHAYVIQSDTNAGKGQTVTAGLMRVDTPRVLFCDGDYIGLRVDHIDKVTQQFKGNPMVVGVPDFPHMSVIPPDFQNQRFVASWPWVSGFRCMATHVALGTPLTGYLMELQLTHANRRAGRKIVFRRCEGLQSPLDFNPERLAMMDADLADAERRGINHG